jgi:hypothetical protein
VNPEITKETYVVYKKETSGARIEEAAPPVAPAQAGDERRENKAHSNNEVEIPSVLELDNLVAGEIRDVGDTRLSTGLDEHPANVGPEEALVGVIGVELGVCVPMVGTMTSGPPADRTLNRARSGNRQRILERQRGVVRSVRPKAVVP